METCFSVNDEFAKLLGVGTSMLAVLTDAVGLPRLWTRDGYRTALRTFIEMQQLDPRSSQPLSREFVEFRPLWKSHTSKWRSFAVPKDASTADAVSAHPLCCLPPHEQAFFMSFVTPYTQPRESNKTAFDFLLGPEAPFCRVVGRLKSTITSAEMMQHSLRFCSSGPSHDNVGCDCGLNSTEWDDWISGRVSFRSAQAGLPTFMGCRTRCVTCVKPSAAVTSDLSHRHAAISWLQEHLVGFQLLRIRGVSEPHFDSTGQLTAITEHLLDVAPTDEIWDVSSLLSQLDGALLDCCHAMNSFD